MTSPRFRVVVRAPLPEGGLAVLDSIAQVTTLEEDTSRADVLAALAEADAFVALLSDRVDAELFARAPGLRVVANYAVGVDNVDLDAARAAGVWVTNTPDVLTEATADLTLGLVLAVTRRFVEADVMVRSGAFAGWKPTLLLGRSLAGKRLGIVGFGRIGRAVAARARAFGLEIVYLARSTPAGAETLGRPVALDELLATSDIVSLHVPLTPQTHHLLDRAALARMRGGAYLVNTARGPVVDEEALAEALESGHLAGAGLDVYEREPAVHPRLLAAPNTVLLPHLGSATLETRLEMARLVGKNVAAVLRDDEPPSAVVRGRR